MHLDIHVGEAFSPPHASSPHELIQNAEEALLDCREALPHAYTIYDPALTTVSGRQHVAHTRDLIIAALNDRRIEIALEPIVNARTGEPAFH